MKLKLVSITLLILTLFSCKQNIELPYKVGDNFDVVEESVNKYSNSFIFQNHAILNLSTCLAVIDNDEYNCIKKIHYIDYNNATINDIDKLYYYMPLVETIEIFGTPKKHKEDNYILIFTTIDNIELELNYVCINNNSYLSTSYRELILTYN